MTIRDIIESADDSRNNTIGTQRKIEWLSQLDEHIYGDIILAHEDHEDYGDVAFPYTDDTQVLIAPDRFKEMYETYLMAKIDLQQAENALYSNDSTIHNSAYADFENWYNANHLPVQKNRFHVKAQYARRQYDVFTNE